MRTSRFVAALIGVLTASFVSDTDGYYLVQRIAVPGTTVGITWPSMPRRGGLYVSHEKEVVVTDVAHRAAMDACTGKVVGTIAGLGGKVEHAVADAAAGRPHRGHDSALVRRLAVRVVDDLDIRDRNQALGHHRLEGWQKQLDLLGLVDDADHDRQIRGREQMLAMNAAARAISFDATVYRGAGEILTPRLLDDGRVPSTPPTPFVLIH